MTFQFRIHIQDVSKPTVWRQIAVPAHVSFAVFHQVLQAAFGWEDCHLYLFSPQGFGSEPAIGIPDPEWAAETKDSKTIRLDEIFTTEGQKFTYIYDFGDDWAHSVLLEKISIDGAPEAALLDGKGACPPEECGGTLGFEQLKEILSNPTYPEHAETKEWLGLAPNERWDAAAFDLAAAQKKVRGVL
jgi:hypothetical protein